MKVYKATGGEDEEFLYLFCIINIIVQLLFLVIPGWDS